MRTAGGFELVSVPLRRELNFNRLRSIETPHAREQRIITMDSLEKARLPRVETTQNRDSDLRVSRPSPRATEHTHVAFRSRRATTVPPSVQRCAPKPVEGESLHSALHTEARVRCTERRHGVSRSEDCIDGGRSAGE